MRARGMVWRALVAGALALPAGCATYSDGIGRVEGLLASGDAAAALKALDEEAGSRKDQVLYLLNRAMILHMAGDYSGSNAAFEQAKPLMERYDAISASEQLGAVSVNDTLRAYAGAPYERIYMHIYSALNHLALNQPREARVEVLQLGQALDNSAKHEPVPAGFGYYLSGLIYESLGEWDDAMIDYRKSYEAYRAYSAAYAVPPPAALKHDLLRAAARQGFNDELARYREESGITKEQNDDPSDDAAHGEVIVVLHSGLAPLMRDTIASAYAADGRLVTIALPYHEPRAASVTQAIVRAAGQSSIARTEAVEDVARMAEAELADEMPLITARAIARAVVKNKAIKQSEREGNESLGLAMNVAALVTERADTRSWSTLPGHIYLAKLALPPGDYDLSLELRDATGALAGTREYKDVTVTAGGKHFISLRWIGARDLTAPHALPRSVRHAQRRAR